MASPGPDTLDQASLERFQTELIEHGFEPVEGDLGLWRGPIADELREHTNAETMVIEFRDGWPFQHPRLIVEGLDADHVGANGEVCLWASGASSAQWTTWQGYRARIAEWAARTRDGFQLEDFALDGHLDFQRRRPGLATVELARLALDERDARLGHIVASWDKAGTRLTIEPGRNGPVTGRWYLIATPPNRRPKNLEEIRSLLDGRQRSNLDKRMAKVRDRGLPQVLLVAWDREFGREALVLLAEQESGEAVVCAIEVAPTDQETLMLRAGPDAELLATQSITLFGAGAIGSHAALILAECGIGTIGIVDHERLRPGNVVRHVAGELFVASPKVDALSFEIGQHAPWTKTQKQRRSTWNATLLAGAATNRDLLIDATGLTSFTMLLAHVAAKAEVPMVSAALYREGAVGRVRRQARETDTPLWLRKPPGYPVIPPSEDEAPRFEVGCSAPVNNASPLAVHSIAAALAESAIDLLTGRFLFEDERIVVFRPLTEPPFDRIGTVS
ncbi:ThiF family adenylyltransferase [Miltoncostaea marina]|uniref:ThiF family adenylyltransferase n=1 Tax=Miltoncostaea marina TaxID=2843215 RepID=UPI001C3DC027|nr:ThiF family adenylyltransferase [Miltoncostaea marina]